MKIKFSQYRDPAIEIDANDIGLCMLHIQEGGTALAYAKMLLQEIKYSRALAWGICRTAEEFLRRGLSAEAPDSWPKEFNSIY